MTTTIMSVDLPDRRNSKTRIREAQMIRQATKISVRGTDLIMLHNIILINTQILV